jgi:putative endonuclease
MTARQAKGAAAEDAAARLLEARGLRVVGRNFRVRGGEIDLVCRDGATTVFVEVRLRTRQDFGGAAASITAAKQARLVLAARHWLARHGQTYDMPCRFDAVLSDGATLEWIRDAFRPAA